ncbi:MAG: hypothetical protein F4168_05500 [Gemmatimonadetes bacterium]|nr:hypothetical protein [Gemmatimonadota bacterium]
MDPLGGGPVRDRRARVRTSHRYGVRLSLYEERLEADLIEIRARLQPVAEQVEDNLRHSVRAVLDSDPRLANETLIKDRAVNQDIRDLDHLCHLFVARHLPSGSHLRFISAVLRLSVALERVGDYSVAICRVARQIGSQLPDTVRHNMEMMAEHAGKALGTALKGFVNGDPDSARVSRGIASQTAAIYPYALEILIDAADTDRRPARDLFGALLVFRLLQRTAEQAENACEMTLFAVMGKRKKEKRYRILFVDVDHALTSRLAQVALEESYPYAGRFGSAGLTPAHEFDSRLGAFCRRRGILLPEGDAPRSFEEALDVGPHYHVVVGIGVDPSGHFDVPYRTAALQWDLAEDGVTAESEVEELYRTLMVRVRGLMSTLGVRDDE